MQVLVTGSSGFIGSHLRKRLDAWGLTRYGSREERDVVGDVTDHDRLNEIVVKKDVRKIYHLAAETIVARAKRIPWTSYNTNVIGTLNVLRVASRYDIDVVVMSTDKVYGNADVIPTDENCPLRPIDIYGATKAAADQATLIFANEMNVNATVMRSVNVYGPGDKNKRIIPNTLRCLIAKNKAVIYDDASTREYIYVDDVVDALIFLMDHIDTTAGEAWNVGTGVRKTQEEVVKDLARFFPSSELLHVKKENNVREIVHQGLNYVKMRTMGWRPRVSWSDGIERTVKWWKKELV
ncbi:MAG: NAD-dependent epimerase/dehydratase family protein [Promethearchaeota archaeon]|nr:MAG: dTDP-glucose 4,6-dehydratase [Helarchaeota virus Nidhogg Meg22_1012]URC17342.1 MAG: dTDP-glucose 4,6-dehydratase [Helarchaeota virus Nidhogg Meg22_1214]